MILAVDPGINACGCALFSEAYPGGEGFLLRAWLVRSESKVLAQTITRCRDTALAVYRSMTLQEIQAINVFVAEWPQVYPPRRGKRSKIDPNVALVPLAGVQAAIAAHLPPAVRTCQYLPKDWKGTIDGDKFLRTIEARMKPYEVERVDPLVPASLRHNVIDAVGLGLKYLGRLNRRVISRGAPR